MHGDSLVAFAFIGFFTVICVATVVIQWRGHSKYRQQRAEEARRDRMRQNQAWLIGTIRATPGFERYCVVRPYVTRTDLSVVSVDTGFGYPIPTSLVNSTRTTLNATAIMHFLREVVSTEAKDFKADLIRSRAKGSGLGCNDIEPVEVSAPEHIKRVPFWERLGDLDL